MWKNYRVRYTYNNYRQIDILCYYVNKRDKKPIFGFLRFPKILWEGSEEICLSFSYYCRDSCCCFFSSFGIILDFQFICFPDWFFWAIIVGTTTIQQILWDIRPIIFSSSKNNLSLVALVGILFNITGAEVYNYSDSATEFTNGLLSEKEIISLLPISNIEITIFIYSQMALIFGSVFAVVLIIYND